MTRNDILLDIDIASHSPGLRAFAFQADLYCLDCILNMANRGVFDKGAAQVDDQADPYWEDSELLPQPCFFPESDHAEHCASCGEYLYGTEGAPS